MHNLEANLVNLYCILGDLNINLININSKVVIVHNNNCYHIMNHQLKVIIINHVNHMILIDHVVIINHRDHVNHDNNDININHVNHDNHVNHVIMNYLIINVKVGDHWVIDLVHYQVNEHLNVDHEGFKHDNRDNINFFNEQIIEGNLFILVHKDEVIIQGNLENLDD